MRRHTLLVCALALMIAGCAAPAPFKAYDGPDLPADQLAVLDWSGGLASSVVLEIDGKGPGNALKAYVLPGQHFIRYGGAFGTSALYGSLALEYDIPVTLHLKPDRTYLFKRRRFYVEGPTDQFWIEDMDTGEILHEAMPPPTRIDLLGRRHLPATAGSAAGGSSP